MAISPATACSSKSRAIQEGSTRSTDLALFRAKNEGRDRLVYVELSPNH